MGNLRLYGSTSGYTELAPPAVAPDGVLSLPSGTGTIATQDYAASAGGLVHINTTTFSAVSSVSLDDVFTSDYDNYKILSSTIGSVGNWHYFRLRVSGTDDTGSNYITQFAAFDGGSTSPARGTQSYAFFGGTSTTTYSASNLELFHPAIARNTSWTGLANTLTSGAYLRLDGGSHTLATAYDGITYYPPSGTITGTIRVYGYANGA